MMVICPDRWAKITRSIAITDTKLEDFKGRKSRNWFFGAGWLKHDPLAK